MPIHDWTRVDAGIFHDFHQGWIIAIRRALNAGLLPPDFYAMVEQVAGGLVPDVLTLESLPPLSLRGKGDVLADDAGEGGIALATAPPKARIALEHERERYARKRSRIAVRHRSGDQVVAVLEIVSPGNKGSRHALRSFVNKAAELIEADIHLMVIDLFPPGPDDPQGINAAIWSEIGEPGLQVPADPPLTVASYVAGELKRAFIEPLALGGPLPEMPLFLLPERYILVPLEPTYVEAFADVPKRWQSVICDASSQ